MAARGPHLKDGADWAEHEDYLVGDEAGLRNLMQACEVAIEKGKCRREDLGDYVGVKCLGPGFSRGTKKPAMAWGPSWSSLWS